ncbi:amidase domain-containing protein [Clostridium tarantellae]|uniref:Putative amidase domain-containing protein n=1 Tax=Clostridium tarantellae TaxID=39493 RepID=A0A6I1MNY4_9CLOT|nr:amidase domain-containing protein [Clostridium tarantellae]MPQ45135.1 hypothetical protein [Clostridium tarantellae]
MKKKILSLILALSTSASISLPVLANEQKTETLLQNKVEEYLITYDDITLKNDTKKIIVLEDLISNNEFEDYISKKISIVNKRNTTFNLNVNEYNHNYKYNSIDIDDDKAYVSISLNKTYNYKHIDEPTFETIDYFITLENINGQWSIIDSISNDEWDKSMNTLDINKNRSIDIDNFIKNETKIIENEKNLMNESLNKPDNDLESEINLDKNSKAYSFNRNAMYNYAKKHYNNPNPNYYDYTSLGGDCTNFVSQIIKAGGAPYDLSGSQSQQWYYKSSNNKSPSWTGVENLDDYLLYNKSTGPQAQNGSVYNAAVGDVVQIDSNSDGKYTHSVSIVYHTNGNMNSTTVAARTSNAFNRALTSYPGAKRWLHLTGYSN